MSMKARQKKPVYCRDCVYFLPEKDSAAAGYESPLCKKTMQETVNPLGHKEFKRYGTMDACKECGHVHHDDRKIIAVYCLVKNKDLDCGDYRPRLWKRIKNKVGL